MANSYVTLTGDGSTSLFTIPFGYISVTDIVVTVNTVVQLGLTFPTSNTVQLLSAPTNGTAIVIRRSTNLNNRAVVFADGTTLTQADLNTAILQNFYAAQEIAEGVTVLTSGTSTAVIFGVLSARPAFGVANRLYVASDTVEIYMDTGSSWILVGSGGVGGLSTTAGIAKVLAAANAATANTLVLRGSSAEITSQSAALTQTASTGNALSTALSNASATGAAVSAQSSGAHFNGVLFAGDMATSDGTAPLAMRLRYNGNSILSIQPLRPDDAGIYQFQYDANFFPTINSANSPIVHHTNTNINIPSGLTITGEYLAHHLQVCRSHDNATDSGSLASLKALHITVGHDDLPGATPTTTSITGINLRLRRNNGTIGNIFGVNFELKEAGATITGNMYGLYDNSDVVYGVGQGLKHCLSGRTTFGSTGVPAESVDVQAGSLKILGTTGNTLKLATAVPNGSVACVFTPNVGPTGAHTAIQCWALVNIQGTDRYIACY